MIEAIHRELAAGQSRGHGGGRGAQSLRRPLLASTMTVIVVFAPLVFTSGCDGCFLPIAGRDARRGIGDFADPRNLLHTCDGTRDSAVARPRARSGTNLSRRSSGIDDDYPTGRPFSRACDSRRDRSAAASRTSFTTISAPTICRRRRRRVRARLHHAAAEHDGRHDGAARLDPGRF